MWCWTFTFFSIYSIFFYFQTMLLITILAFHTTFTNKKFIKCLIMEGVKIFSDSQQNSNSKFFKFLSIKIIFFDFIVIILNCIGGWAYSEDANEKYLAFATLFMAHISYFVTNSFSFILTIIRFEFHEINLNLQLNVLQENKLELLKDFQAYRHLCLYCKQVVHIFSNVLIANFFYSFTTSLAGVSLKKA